jgi:hypothetical protein
MKIFETIQRCHLYIPSTHNLVPLLTIISAADLVQNYTKTGTLDSMEQREYIKDQKKKIVRLIFLGGGSTA